MKRVRSACRAKYLVSHQVNYRTSLMNVSVFEIEVLYMVQKTYRGDALVKQVLDTMFEEYATIVDQLGLAENLENDNDDANIPKEIILLRNCVDMYDQEYMVKVMYKARAEIKWKLMFQIGMYTRYR